MNYLLILWKKLQIKGFVGPAYTGLLGKFRFAWEEYVQRTDVILVATRDMPGLGLSEACDQLDIRIITSSNGLGELCKVFDIAYYPGFTANWKCLLDSGEVLIVGFLKGALVAFIWMQTGKSAGVGCYYGVFLEGDIRLYRAGVVPVYRTRGIYTRFIRDTLYKIFHTNEVNRVYIDCHRANIAAYKAHIKGGFREIGSITVIRGFGGRRFIRWR